LVDSVAAGAAVAAPAGVFRIRALKGAEMSKTVNDPKEIFPEIVGDYQSLYAGELISVILYGSAAGKDFLPGKSDLNFMIVLSEKGMEHLDRAFSVITKWRKRDVAIPLFLTEKYIDTSMDVFPIEYLNFRSHYIVAFGKDVLEGLRFDRRFIRLQCEREIKGKLLLLREAFIESLGKARSLKEVIRQSLPALVACFSALLYLKEMEVPTQKREVLRRTSEVFHLDAQVFEQLLGIKEERVKLGEAELIELFKKYLCEMDKLAIHVDSMGG
jgi:hypothetical protein